MAGAFHRPVFNLMTFHTEIKPSLVAHYTQSVQLKIEKITIMEKL